MIEELIPDSGEHKSFRRWAGVALGLHLIAAVFTEGWYALDEHWQIIEFASAILGRVSRDTLAWEYAARLRPSLQPYFYAGIECAMLGVGSDNPFVLATVFRIATSLFAWAATVLAALVAIKWLGKSPLRKWAMPSLALAWFLPYLHARTSSENAAETAFLFGFAILALNMQSIRPAMAGLAGFAFGLSFEFRYQCAFMAAGAVAWCLFIVRMRAAALAAMFGGGLAAIAIGTVADRLFYGQWVLVPLNYFRVNITEHRASSYGELPWWWYGPRILENGAPPLSAILVLGAVIGCVRNPRSLATWSLVPFLLVHFVIGHKEARFLFPLATLAIILTLLALDEIRGTWRSRWVRGFAIAMVVENVVLLTFATFRPARADVSMYRKIYALTPAPTIYFVDRDPFAIYRDLTARFYERPELKMVELPSYAEFDRKVGATDAWIVVKGFDLPPSSTRSCDPYVRTLPTWMRNFNFNHWLDRTPVWTLFRCRQITVR